MGHNAIPLKAIENVEVDNDERKSKMCAVLFLSSIHFHNHRHHLLLHFYIFLKYVFSKMNNLVGYSNIQIHKM